MPPKKNSARQRSAKDGSGLDPKALTAEQRKCCDALGKDGERVRDSIATAESNLKQKTWTPTIPYLQSLKDQVANCVQVSETFGQHVTDDATRAQRTYKPELMSLMDLIKDMHQNIQYEAPKSFKAMRTTIDKSRKEIRRRAGDKSDADAASGEGDIEEGDPEASPSGRRDKEAERRQQRETETQFKLLEIMTNAEACRTRFEHRIKAQEREMELKCNGKDILTMQPIGDAVLNDFRKNMERHAQKLQELSQDAHDKVEKLQSDIRKGQQDFEDVNAQLADMRKEAQNNKTMEWRAEFAEYLSQMRQISDGFTQKEWEGRHEPLFSELEVCLKKMQEVSAAMKKVKCDSYFWEEKEDSLQEGGKIICQVQRFAIQEAEKMMQSIDEQFDSPFESEEISLAEKFKKTQDHVALLGTCTTKLRAMRGIDEDNQGFLLEVVSQIDSMRTKTESAMIKYISSSATEKQKDFEASMDALDLTNVTPAQWKQEFKKHSEYEQILTLSKKNLANLKDVTQENKSNFIDTKEMIEKFMSEFTTAKKSYDSMDSARIRKGLTATVNKMVTTAKEAFEGYRSSLVIETPSEKATDEKAGAPREEELKKIKTLLGEKKDAIEKLKSNSKPEFHDIFDPTIAEINELDPDKLYQEAVREYRKLQAEEFKNQIDELVAMIRQRKSEYDSFMCDCLENNLDPGNDKLDGILGSLNEAEHKMKRMEGFGDEDNQVTVSKAQIYFTKARQEAKTQYKDAFNSYMTFSNDLMKKKKDFIDELAVNKGKADGIYDRFAHAISEMESSPGQRLSDDIMVESYFRECKNDFGGVSKSLLGMKAPVKELEEDVKKNIADVEDKLKSCENMSEKWKKSIEEPKSSETLRFTLSETGSMVDILNQNKNGGLVCTIRADALRKDVLSCRTLGLSVVDTTGQELVSNVVQLTLNSEEPKSVCIGLPYEAKGTAPYKHPQIIVYDPDINQWIPLKSAKVTDQGATILEAMTRLHPGKTVQVAVAAKPKLKILPAGRKELEIISETDKKVKAHIMKETFSNITPFTLQSIPMMSSVQVSAKTMLKWPEDAALASSAIVGISAGDTPRKAIILEMPVIGNHKDKNKAKGTSSQGQADTKRISHVLLRSGEEDWREISSSISDSSQATCNMEVSPIHMKNNKSTRAMMIQTSPTTLDVVEMAEVIEKNEENPQQMYLTMNHRLYTEAEMNNRVIFEELQDRKYTAGPQFPSPEFRIREGEKMAVSTDKNITFSGAEGQRILTFHSNFKSACMEEKLLYKDEFAQASFDEYHGLVLCHRHETRKGEEICKIPVTLPKEQLRRERTTFIQAKNVNVIMTDEFLRELVPDIVMRKEEFEASLEMSSTDLEKLRQKYPDDEEDQVFHLIRNIMKGSSMQKKEETVKKIYHAMENAGLIESAGKLKTRYEEYLAEKYRRIYDEKMLKTFEFMKMMKATLEGWKNIYRELMIKTKEMQAIDGDIFDIESKEKSPKEHIHLSLSLWRDAYNGYPKVEILIKVLKRLKLIDAAERIEKLWSDYKPPK